MPGQSTSWVFMAIPASGLLGQPSRLWVGGVEMTAGGSAPTSAGSAVYDPDSRTLTMTDAVIEGEFRGAAIYAEGPLILRLRGANRLRGEKAGVTALSDLTVSGHAVDRVAFVVDVRSRAFFDDFQNVLEQMDRIAKGIMSINSGNWIIRLFFVNTMLRLIPNMIQHSNLQPFTIH